MKSPDWSKKMNSQKLNRAEYSHVLVDNEYRENADDLGAGLQVVGGVVILRGGDSQVTGHDSIFNLKSISSHQLRQIIRNLFYDTGSSFKVW